jgi:subtilisin
MIARDALAQARETIARQAEEIACLRQLVHTLSEHSNGAAGATASIPAAAPPAGRLADEWMLDWLDDSPDVVLPRLERIMPLDHLTPEWAWGGSTGHGVRVAVIDSGISARHPSIGRVDGYLAIREGSGGLSFDTSPHDDEHGHGTACASLIRTLAPECELYSVKVLGPRLEGGGAAFAAAIRWAIDSGIRVCNLSLGTIRPELFAPLHQLADEAYFQNMILVAAANNEPRPSFPASYASVISVAAIRAEDPEHFFYYPSSPIEFRAAGIGVRVAWPKRRWQVQSGNSFAAPQLSGLVARILAKHPSLTPFHVKSVLRALAANVGDEAS